MTTTKTIRMTTETAEFLKGKDARLILENTCEFIKKGKIKYNNSGLHIAEPTAEPKEPKEELASENLEVMCALNGISVSELLEQIEGMLDEGEITIDGGKLNFYDGAGEVLNGLQEEMKNLKDACDEKGIEIGKALDKAFRTGIEMASRDIWHL